MPKKAEFISEIERIFTNARNRGDKYVEIISKDLHTKLGGYPGRNHSMPSCCDAMYDIKKDSDEIISAPTKGKGATLKIRYYL